MNGRVFLDTNVLVYTYSNTEPIRGVPFEKLVTTIHEFSENFTIVQITVHTIEYALNIATQYNYSYFDSLMLSAALEHHCSVIYTEDMHHAHTLDTLTIKNPFK